MKEQRVYKIDGVDMVMLGSLDCFVCFRFPGDETIYRTMDYAPYNTCHSADDRWCMNMTTYEAKIYRCRRKVVPVIS